MRLILVLCLQLLALCTSIHGFLNAKMPYGRVVKQTYQLVVLGDGLLNDVRNNSQKLQHIAEPLLDYELVQRTIKEWTRPLPVSVISSPLVIVGPSGVGKGKLIRGLLKDYVRFFRKVVTYTTRSPRDDEVNGKNYYFITRTEFETRVSNGFFLENARVHDNLYGISHEEWDNVQKASKIPILEIDIQGARTIKSLSHSMGIKPKFLFVAPTNISMLEQRLKFRGSESSAEVNLRLETARRELVECREPGLFHTTLINEDLGDTTLALFRLIRDWYPCLPSAARMQMLRRRLKNIKNMAMQEAAEQSREVSAAAAAAGGGGSNDTGEQDDGNNKTSLQEDRDSEVSTVSRTGDTPSM